MEKHSFPLQEEATEQTPKNGFRSSFFSDFSPCYFVICKTSKTKYFPQS